MLVAALVLSLRHRHGCRHRRRGAHRPAIGGGAGPSAGHWAAGNLRRGRPLRDCRRARGFADTARVGGRLRPDAARDRGEERRGRGCHARGLRGGQHLRRIGDRQRSRVSRGRGRRQRAGGARQPRPARPPWRGRRRSGSRRAGLARSGDRRRLQRRVRGARARTRAYRHRDRRRGHPAPVSHRARRQRHWLDRVDQHRRARVGDARRGRVSAEGGRSPRRAARFHHPRWGARSGAGPLHARRHGRDRSVRRPARRAVWRRERHRRRAAGSRLVARRAAQELSRLDPAADGLRHRRRLRFHGRPGDRDVGSQPGAIPPRHRDCGALDVDGERSEPRAEHAGSGAQPIGHCQSAMACRGLAAAAAAAAGVSRRCGIPQHRHRWENPRGGRRSRPHVAWHGQPDYRPAAVARGRGAGTVAARLANPEGIRRVRATRRDRGAR